MKRKPKVGETLYSLNVGNAAHHREQKLTEVEVLSVGRKYFTCRPKDSKWSATQFHIDTWRQKTEYSSDECLYETPQEWEDDKEHVALADKIGRLFKVYGRCELTLEQLRAIDKIIATDEPS